MRQGGYFDVDVVKALQRDATALVGEFVALMGRVRDSAGADGAAIVELDHAGLVSGVELVPDWRTTVGPQGLPETVLAAVRQAMVARASAEAVVAVGDPVDGGKGAGDAVPGDPGSPESVGNLRDLLAVLDRFDAELASAADAEPVEGAAEVPPVPEVAGSSPNGTVTARMTEDGSPVAIEVDPDWLHAASDERIGRALRDALYDAQRQTSPPSGGADGASTASAELRRLTERPEVLLRKLGLIR
ncbi:YbaB/EbfC family nucleoid-associated protein [Micromonospora sp. NPDC049799]|uniref:YbaB/EbfC family nucleoid-associated protein n=1 Tax=Micromonospora sp. NPDC049799 TaxID=3154741 RepID=UPI0033F184DD